MCHNQTTMTTPTTLFLDIGGVLLTNGWDRNARKQAAQQFNLDLPELEERHHLTFDTYEEGKLSLEEYLTRIVFYERRSFTREAFINFIQSQSQPYDDMINMICDLKKNYNLKIAVVNNEGKEFNEFRISKFKLNSFVDFFISSCYVHMRKPDADIFKLALDIAQVAPEDVLYIEDRPMFVSVAEGLDIKGIVHKDYESTKEILKEHGLTL